MKKIFLFICSIALLGITSCSKDDSRETSGTVIFSVNGSQKTLTQIVKTTDPQYPLDYIITATDGDFTIEFSYNKSEMGDDTIYYLSYITPDAFYPDDATTLTSNISEISPSKVKGTFSCSVVNESDATDVLSITNGSFDINY